MWKIKYYAIALIALAVNSDRLWEKAWAYGFWHTTGQKPTEKQLNDIFGRP